GLRAGWRRSGGRRGRGGGGGGEEARTTRSRTVRRPGDVVLRRRRVQTEVFALERPRRMIRLRPTPWYLVGAFGAAILIGAALLSLPWASESGRWTNGLDALFTATSAVCVTGLVRVDTAEHWSGFGEAVIIALIQIGGLGVTIYAGSLLVLLGRRFGLRGSSLFGMELTGSGEWDIGRLLRRVLIYVAVAELLTFLLLLPWFLIEFGGAGAVWSALFHAVSAFNSAGFDLMGGRQSFQAQIGAPYPLIVMGVAAFLGSLSFVTVFDLRRGWRRWSLDTRMVVLMMAGLLVGCMALFLAAEVQSGRVLDGRTPLEALVNSFFLSVNRTTGMSAVDMGALQDVTTVVLLPLMFIGGASTSTASGIKVGTFVVGLAVVVSSLRGRHQAELFGREIPHAVVLRAIAVVLLGIVALTVGVVAMMLAEDGPVLPLVFEAMSGLANVGWSQGVTATLSGAGTAILIVLMFVGRLAPLMVALTVPDRGQARYRYPAEGVRIG
ncbi:MAG: hypothetical protein OXG38_05775, partial [Chloroflexi bacterium]|nr:hypothetical protein [Chloroflexota bacterium]